MIVSEVDTLLVTSQLLAKLRASAVPEREPHASHVQAPSLQAQAQAQAQAYGAGRGGVENIERVLAQHLATVSSDVRITTLDACYAKYLASALDALLSEFRGALEVRGRVPKPKQQ